MGPAVPPIESVRRMVPKDHLWTADGPADEYWNFHAGGGAFKTMQVFTDALNARYGKAASAEDFTYKSQLMTYEGVRAMYEAYGRNKYASTGVIQWMLNNAWPSMIWHLYDYYLDAGGGYYGTKKACEPVHVQYSYDDRSVYVVNSEYRPAGKLEISAALYDLHMKEIFSQHATVDSGADSSLKALTIPAENFSGDSAMYFVQLFLRDSKGTIVSRNFYWVPSKPTAFDWDKTDYTHTPASSHEDFTALRQLPKAHIESSLQVENDGSWRVRLHNSSNALAFQVAVEAADFPVRDDVEPRALHVADGGVGGVVEHLVEIAGAVLAGLDLLDGGEPPPGLTVGADHGGRNEGESGHQTFPPITRSAAVSFRTSSGRPAKMISPRSMT